MRYVEHPVEEEGYKCEGLFYRAWEQCDNFDRGGAVDAGCLRYVARPMLMDMRHGWDDWKEDKLDRAILDEKNFNDPKTMEGIDAKEDRARVPCENVSEGDCLQRPYKGEQ